MTDLEAMNVMAEKDMDIRVATSIVKADMCKAGGLITVGVDPKTFQELIPQLSGGEPRFYLLFFVVNKEQLDRLKTQNNERPNNPDGLRIIEG